MTMFSYLAAICDVGFATSILVGPQRQSALLAKQAAEVDLLCGGRFRLGLGIGWNRVEYEALGASFEQRGAVLEEQIAVLRQLWTQESVTFQGRFHTITAAGIAPRPTRSIPIWIGAFAPTALRRVGRLADGWFPMTKPGGGLDDALAHIEEGARSVGRTLSDIAFEGRVEFATGDPDKMAQHAQRWRDAGASHLTVNTMNAGLKGVDEHIAALATVAETLRR
jgi:probable F420-dependent oxidoreductase